MTWRDWLAILEFLVLMILFAVGPAIVARRRRGDPSTRPVFSKPETASWAIAVGVLLLGVGAFATDAPDLRTLFLSVGASILGGGVVAALSI